MSSIRLSHPRRARLHEWLETGHDERVTQHVERCDRCAQVLEEMSQAPGSPELEPEQLGDAIRAAMVPPDDLNERVMQRIEARRLAERELSLFLGLFSIPRDAMDLMMPPGPGRGPAVRPAIEPGDEETQREELE